MALDIVSANHHGDVDLEYLIESQTEEGLMDRIRYHSRIRRLPIRTILVVALLVATGVLGLYAITPRQERVAPTSRTVVTPTWRSLAPPAIVRSPSRVPQSLYDDAANFIVDHETATRKKEGMLKTEKDVQAFRKQILTGGPEQWQVEKLPSARPGSEEWLLDVVREGTIELPSGMILNLYPTLCVGTDFIAVVAKDETQYQQLQYCCVSDVLAKQNCSSTMMSMCRASRMKEMLRSEFWRPSEVSSRNLTVLPGLSWWMYTPGKTEHIGHYINRLLQLFHARMDPNVPTLDWLVSNRMRIPLGEHTHRMFETLIGDQMSKTWLRMVIDQLPNQAICMERAMEVDISQHERTFFTHDQAQHFRDYALRNFFPQPPKPQAECPPPKAVVLQRKEGTGLRQILNFDVLERVLKRNGIQTYENVSVSSTDDTEGHIKVFSDFGLMIAPHSSQLKNTIFSPKNAIVLEVRGTPEGYLTPSPFYWGTEQMDLVFELSQGHTPDLSSCPEAHGCTTMKKYKTDFWLVEELFERAVQNALRKQQERCGDIWSQTGAVDEE